MRVITKPCALDGRMGSSATGRMATLDRGRGTSRARDFVVAGLTSGERFSGEAAQVFLSDVDAPRSAGVALRVFLGDKEAPVITDSDAVQAFNDL